MTIAVTVKQTLNFGAGKCVLADVTMDSGYVTGGELVTPAQLGLSGVNHVQVSNPPLGGFGAAWNPATNAISLWVHETATAALIEHANTVTAATAVVPIVAFGY